MTDYANIKQKKQTKKEAWLTFNQRITNLNVRQLAGANLDSDHISQVLKDQLLSSTSCGIQLEINDKNEMSRRITCKKRFCRSCCRYMAFEREMAFYPSVNKIIQAHKRDKDYNAKLWLVTLTLPTCEAWELVDRILHVQDEWRYMYKYLKHDDTKGYVNGLRKLEINPNPKKEVLMPLKHTDYMYHAHLHILIQGRGNAYALRNMWLRRHPEASKKAQHVIPFNVDDSKGGVLCELLKYLAKPVVSSDRLFASRATNQALAFIYDKLRGRRTIFSYGTVKKAKKFKMHVVNGEVVIQHNDKYEQAFSDSSKKMQEKLVRYINNEKAKASRPLGESIFKWFNGMYVEQNTGELLCTEQDIIDSVKETDAAASERKRKKKKQGQATKMNAYYAERAQFKKAHGMTVGKGKNKQTLEALDEKIKRVSEEQKEKEKAYLGFRLLKNNPQDTS